MAMNLTMEGTMDKYLVDSPVWILYLQGNAENIREKLQPLLDEDRISINGVILSELLVAAQGKKEFQFIKEHFLGLHFLETNKDFYVKLAKIIKELKKSKQILTYADYFKMTHAHLFNHTLISLNKNFRNVSQVIGFRYETI